MAFVLSTKKKEMEVKSLMQLELLVKVSEFPIVNNNEFRIFINAFMLP